MEKKKNKSQYKEPLKTIAQQRKRESVRKKKIFSLKKQLNWIQTTAKYFQNKRFTNFKQVGTLVPQYYDFNNTHTEISNYVDRNSTNITYLLTK